MCDIGRLGRARVSSSDPIIHCCHSCISLFFSTKDVKKEFETNFFGAMKMTQAVLPFMRPQKSGIIMFMGSIAAWYSAAAGGLYASSKCALEGKLTPRSHSKDFTAFIIITNFFQCRRCRISIQRSLRSRYSCTHFCPGPFSYRYPRRSERDCQVELIPRYRRLHQDQG